jgi:hypothetical protein
MVGAIPNLGSMGGASGRCEAPKWKKAVPSGTLPVDPSSWIFLSATAHPAASRAPS